MCSLAFYVIFYLPMEKNTKLHHIDLSSDFS